MSSVGTWGTPDGIRADTLRDREALRTSCRAVGWSGTAIHLGSSAMTNDRDESMQPVTPVTYDRRAIIPGIVHIGVGNFHRAHEAFYVDRLLRMGIAATWGISGIGIMPADARMRDALRSQDLEYTLIERHPSGIDHATRIGAIVEYLYAPDELDRVLERLAAPSTRIVSLTVTEGGYNISDATGEFDAGAPAVVADARPGAKPSTVFGIVTAGLRRRRDRGVPPFAVLSCDNVQANGAVARNSFVAFATMADPELAAWMRDNVAFPNAMVDRITPVTTDADRRWVRERFGIDDAWPVVTESFAQWIVEDDFPNGRPRLDQVGVQLVDDVRPYELMKLRLLNASHQAMAYFGLMKGEVYVEGAASDPQLIELMTRYMNEEATPTLEPVPGVDLDAYKLELLERFANPHVGDTLARLATDGSDRIPKFVVPVARERRAAGEDAPLSAAIIASWARYAALVTTGGADLPFADRQRERIEHAVARQRTDLSGFLRDPDWFGDLADDARFAADFARAYSLMTDGPDISAALRLTLSGSLIQ
jgi:mannitol 2-dehydrogenase